MIRLIAIGAFAALASGCVTSAVYEESWAQQVQVETGACPIVDGIYQNAGEKFTEDGSNGLQRKDTSLAHLLNGGWDSPAHSADDRLGTTFYDASADSYQTVSLRLDEGKLRVEAMLADGTTRKFAMPVKHRCHDSLLVLETGFGYDLFAAGFMHGYYALGRAEDGSLLAYQHFMAEALAVFWNSESYWTRFPSVASNPDAEIAQATALTP